MNPDRWHEIDELFRRALERNEHERHDFVRARAGADSDLRREVESLLAAADRAEGFLERPAMGGVSSVIPIDDHDPAAVLGHRFGAYRAQSVIATGGMGTVYLGVRDDDVFDKHVAIKLIRPGAGGSSTGGEGDRLRRFRFERQVLAELDHPNIARLLDGGASEDGLPYLVMEHVEGTPIDVFCDRTGATVPDRLRLFVKVCDAVQHAHRHLIVHRDLKPSNILVTHDAAPKLLDFGLAKLVDPHRAVLRSEHTTAGTFMGTIAYAAPEQVCGEHRAQDTRTDVYALGVIFYRILTGRHPYPIDGSMADVLDQISNQTPAPPSSINPRVGSELDAIALRGLAKEPARRYQSAGEFGADIERLLTGEPVLARSDSRWYTLRKTVRRHRVGFGVIAGVVVLTGLFAVAMALQASRLAQRGRELAQTLQISNIERARALAATGSVHEAEQILWGEYFQSTRHGAPPDRFAAWALRELYFAHPVIKSQPIDAEGVLGVSLSGDGSRVLAWGAAYNPIVLDRLTGDVIAASDRAAEPNGDTPVFLEESGDVLAGTKKGTLIAFDAQTGTPLWEEAISGESTRPFPPDVNGRIACRIGVGAGVVDLDARRLAAVADMPAHVECMYAAMDPRGELLAVACDDGHVRIFDAETGASRGTWLEPSMFSNMLAWSIDGELLAAKSAGTDIDVVDREGKHVARLRGATGWIRSIEFHPANPTLVLAASVDKSAYLWEIPSGRLVATFGAHDRYLEGAQFIDGGRRILTYTTREIREWDFERRHVKTEYEAASTVFDARFTRDGARILTAGSADDHAVTIADRLTGETVARFEDHSAGVRSIAVHPDGQRIATVSHDGAVYERSIQDPARPARLLARLGPLLNSASHSPDGELLAVGDDDATVHILDASDGSTIDRFGYAGDRIPSLRFAPSGRILAIAVAPREGLVLRDLQTGDERSLNADRVRTRVVRFSPDGSVLATAGDDLTIRLWSMRDGVQGARQTSTLTGHQSDVFALAFSPDQSVLASAGRGGRVKVWDMPTGRCLATFDISDDMIFALDFGPDADTLLSAGRGGRVTVWDLASLDAFVQGNAQHARAMLRDDGG